MLKKEVNLLKSHRRKLVALFYVNLTSMENLAENKRAGFDYEILEKFSAGVELIGHEVKSAKMGHFNLAGAHAIIRNGEVYILGASIPSFQPGNAPENYDSERTKKLLLKQEEIKYLLGKTKSGLTLVPTRAYTNRGLIKIEIALARGRKKSDKRELIKKRETEREIRRISQ